MISDKKNLFLGVEDNGIQKEILESAEYVTLTEKWKVYLDENDEQSKQKYFIDFCTFYKKILENKSIINIMSAINPKVTHEIMKEAIQYIKNISLFLVSIDTLTSTLRISLPSKLNDTLLGYFECSLDCSANYSKIITESSPYFTSIFSQRSITADLANSTFLEKIIPKYYIQIPSINAVQYIYYFVFEQLDKSFFGVVNYKKLISVLIPCMKDSSLQNELKPHLALFYCSLFDQISKIHKGTTLTFFDFDSLNSFENILSEPNRQQFYLKLIMSVNDDKSPPPNIQFLKYVYTVFQMNEHLQNPLFEVILGIIQTDPTIIQKMNSIIQIKKWFESTKINLKSALILLSISRSNFPDDIPNILENFFKILEATQKSAELDTELCLNVFNFLDSLFTKRLVSLKFLISLNFLKIFVRNPSNKQLVDFFTNAPNFTQLTLDILSHELSNDMKEPIFDSIISMDLNFENLESFISICSAFLIVAPLEANISRVKKEIEKNEKYNLVAIFIKSFPKSIELTDSFISLGLHEWISEIFNRNLIDIYVLSNTFAALSAQKPYREIDLLISSFDQKHPIFSLDKGTIDKIVYGLKDISSFPHRPIRVSSLFHLLDCPERCSPYNAWIIGKYCLSNFEDFEKVPLLPCVANRFMHADDVERSLKYPKMFEKFCDMTYDHFSMFQFYAGTEEMKVDVSFQSVSFWFIFSEELEVDVQLFHTTSLMISINQDSFTAICDGQTIVVDVEPQKWTHVFVRLESSLMSQALRITLSNENTIVFQMKNKIAEFKDAYLSAARGSPMLFIGSAIRFSSLVPKDFSMIFRHGPRYIEPSDELNESLLVTPFALSNVTIPLNCFPVPYMGFPVHNLSNHNFKVMMRHLMETEDVETYNSVFRAICNINKITQNYNKRFWKQLLYSVKHAKIFPSTELFESALETVIISPKRCDKIFGTILYGYNLWNIVDNETLVCALFDSFPNVIWKNYQDSDVFLAKIVEKNPSSMKIISKIIINNRRVPKTVKLLASLLKSAPIIPNDWNSVENRPNSVLQLSIIECIINIIDKNNFEFFRQLFSFDELKYMFITAQKPLAAKIFHLIVLLAAYVADFIQLDYSFLLKLVSLCNFVSVWNDTMFLVSGDPDCKTNHVRRPQLIPLLMHLIWSGGVFMVHCKSYELDPGKLETLFNKAVNFLILLIPQIIQKPEYFSIISTYYPLILNYTVLFDDSFCLENIQSPVKIPLLKPSNLGEIDDPLWAESISRVRNATEFPEPPPVKTTKEFLKSILSEFIVFPEKFNLNNSEQLNKSEEEKHENENQSENTNFDKNTKELVETTENKDDINNNSNNNELSKNDRILKNIEEYIQTSRLFVLLCDIILYSGANSTSLSLSLFVSQPFINVSRSEIFVKHLVHVLLTRAEVHQLQTALSVAFLFSGKHYLFGDSIRLYQDLFNLCKKTKESNNADLLQVYSNSFMQIFLDIFPKIPNEDYSSVYKVISENAQLFAQLAELSKMTKCWIYGFSIAFQEIEDMSNVLKYFLPLLKQKPTTQDTPQQRQQQQQQENQVDSTLKEPNRSSEKEIYSKLTPEMVESCQEDWSQFNTNILALYEQIKASLVTMNTISVISESSLEYTKKIYIANCKHYIVRLLLNDTFLFYDSSFSVFTEKRRWSNFLVIHQEQRSSKSKFNPLSYHLSPRCAPFYPPKILAPSPLPYYDGQKDHYANSPIIEMVKKHHHQPPKLDKKNLISLFNLCFRKWGNSLIVQECQISRYDYLIPTISFWYAQSIILLTYAKIKNGDIELIEEIEPKNMHIFYESVFLGHFGITTLFVSHIAIVVPFYSILYVSRYNLTSLAFWTFNSGHFLLQFEAKQLNQVVPYLDKINKAAVDSFPLENYLTQNRTNYDALMMFTSKKITAQQFMFSINALSGRSFVDLEHFPFIPKSFNNEIDRLDKDIFPDKKVTASLLNRILPFKYFSDESSVDISQFNDIPANLLVIPEILIDINNSGVGNINISGYARSPRHFSASLRASLENEENREMLIHWVRSHFNLTPRSSSFDQNRWDKVIGGGNNRNPLQRNVPQNTTAHSRPADQIPRMANRLHRQKTTVISVSRRLSRLTFVNNLTDKVLFCEYHHLYGLAESISVSIDGVFFVIDFAFGITRAYKVIFSKGNPTRAKCISEFSAGAKPMSSVSGHDWVCATASGKRLAMWEIIKGTIHRLIKFESKITALSFDESGYYVWVAVGQKIVIVGINGHILAENEVPENITALMHIDRKTTALCGTEHGRICMLSFDLNEGSIKYQVLETKHNDPIEKIILQRSAKCYLSIDVTGKVERWNPEGGSIEDESPIFTSCAVCTNPTHTICQFCNKPICAQCLPNHLKGPNCRHCIAFI